MVTHIYSLTPSYTAHTLSHLLLEEEGHAVAHLVSVDGGEGDVEEEAVQDGFGDPLQREGQQQHRHADEDVGSQRRQPGLLHLNDTEETHTTHRHAHIITHTNEWLLEQLFYTMRQTMFSSRIFLSVFLHIFHLKNSQFSRTSFQSSRAIFSSSNLGLW